MKYPKRKRAGEVQKLLFSGLKCLPGQLDLFPADGPPDGPPPTRGEIADALLRFALEPRALRYNTEPQKETHDP